jgi:hypothetical protein
MCFSTEASFIAAILLATTGGLTLITTTSRSQFLLAAIPLLFALQQFSEGFVWLHFSHHGSNSLFINAQRAFLTFAFFIWPIWIPLSLAIIEHAAWRRLLLFILLYCGFGLSLLNLSYAVQEEISVQVVNHSLQYMIHVPKQALIYPLIVILPCFLSSLKNMWIFGILVMVGYIVAESFYRQNFVSVWCFFAAIISLSIYKILKDNQRHDSSKEKTQNSGNPIS